MQRSQRIAVGILGTGLVAAALGFSLGSARASAEDAVRTLGFESTGDWTAVGAVATASEDRTQASHAISLLAGGYTTLTSRLLGPLGSVADTVSFDLKIPATQVNPHWFGDAQLFVSIPSLNVYDAFVGQRALTGLTPASYTELAFPLPLALREQLSQTVYDIQFKIALNVPSGNAEPYLVDNLQVSSMIPGRSTISSPDIPRILAFESSFDWSGPSGTAFTSAIRSEGNSALGMSAGGYNVVTSVPMTSIALVGSEITLDVFVPELQPNPGWYGAVALYLSIPSKNVYNQHLGEVQLTGKPTGEFSTVSFPLSSSLQATLNAGGYSDLRFSIALNIPQGAGTYIVDRLHVGEVTALPPPVTAQLRDDIVGRTASAVANVALDGMSDSPEVLDTLIKIKEEDEGCVPSATTVCRYMMNQIRFAFGPFTLDRTYSHATITSIGTARFSLGGVGGFSAPIRGIPFNGKLEDGSHLLWLHSTALIVTYSPTNQLLNLAIVMSGDSDGHTVAIGGVATADVPLLNRRPVADAGPAKVATPGTGCHAYALMDGSGTMDPSGDLELTKWYHRGALYGRGLTPNIEFRRSGIYQLELVATDSFFADSRDTTTVSVSLPSSCGSLDL